MRRTRGQGGQGGVESEGTFGELLGNFHGTALAIIRANARVGLVGLQHVTRCRR